MGPATPPGNTHRPVGVARPLLAVVAVVLVGLAVPLSGCGGGGDTGSSSSSGSAGGGVKAVTIKDYKYAPPSLTVPVGTVIKFTNEDSTPHTATSKQAGVFESGPIDTGKSATVKLEKTGTFTYTCVFHPFMKGTITVK